MTFWVKFHLRQMSVGGICHYLDGNRNGEGETLSVAGWNAANESTPDPVGNGVDKALFLVAFRSLQAFQFLEGASSRLRIIAGDPLQ